MKRVFIICLLSLIFCVSLSADNQGRENVLLHYQAEQEVWKDIIANSDRYIGDTNIDIKFYHLILDIGLNAPFIKGSVLMKFSATANNINAVRLNLQQNLMIDSITGDAASFTANADTFTVSLNRTLQLGENANITVFYHGVPALANGLKGLNFHGRVIASLSTPFLAHFWWPCKDGPEDKSDSVYVDITIPDTQLGGLPFIAVSNGLLKETITANGFKTFKWRHRYPIVPYYVMVAISNYKKYTQNYTGISGEQFPIDYYLFNENYNASLQGIAHLPDAMTLYSDRFGSYPFNNEKYGMTELGFYGAIENQTNTIQNSLKQDWFYTSIHELGHMWFGDMITCKNWQHGWLNEGFASYCEALYKESVSGVSGYKTYMTNFEFYSGGSVYLPATTDPFNVFLSIIYEKGAYVLHMLRGVLGDEVFFNCLKTYATDDRFRFKQATTEDFRDVCEQVSGIDLDYFFDQWIYDQYYPKYYYGFNQDEFSFTTQVQIRQIQVAENWRPVFKMPIQLKFNFIDGSSSLVTVNNELQDQIYQFDFTQKVLSMQFDPDKWILKNAQQVNSIEDQHSNQNFYLSQNYPNPFNPETTINYELQSPSSTKLTVYNAKGELVKELINEMQSSGKHHVKFDASGLNSGVYIYKLSIPQMSFTRKMLLVK